MANFWRQEIVIYKKNGLIGLIQKRKYSVDDLENEPKENKQTKQIIHSIGTSYFKLINNLFGYELLRFYSITGHSSNHEASYEYAKL